MTRNLLLTLAMMLALPTQALADTLLLVPGYLSGGHSWRANGITQGLIASGWKDGGNFRLGQTGAILDLPPQSNNKRFYTVELPSEAPLPLQASYLNRYIDAIRAMHPDDKLFLAGHSAGGVLARYVMVSRPAIKADALVTIASPHSGTDAAEMGKLVAESPASWFAPLFGLDTVNRSRGLYHDLSRPAGHNLLGWLNTRQHPDARYVSIVRPDDEWVDVHSQNMNMVPGLAGKSSVLVSTGTHELNPGDGLLLSRVLAKLSL